jgi:hypothetical protein
MRLEMTRGTEGAQLVEVGELDAALADRLDVMHGQRDAPTAALAASASPAQHAGAQPAPAARAGPTPRRVGRTASPLDKSAAAGLGTDAHPRHHRACSRMCNRSDARRFPRGVQ